MSPFRGGILLLAFALPACAGRAPTGESTAEACTDGQDNDDDGAIDCADPDCQRLAFCPPTDGRTDEPASDSHIVPTDGNAPNLDQSAPDAQASSYGTRCKYTVKNTKCPDQVSVCVPAKYYEGFCTLPCTEGSTCPAGPAGTDPRCAYIVSYSGEQVRYCIFDCSTGQPCPNSMQCLFTQFCW